ncbi:hypothetical protein [Photobacterium leiognathi]|uniref:hypothetical protein n=1 Tax=Photobacterium leiognathi TaxID=553611 RepID=UPI0027390BB3|nr:hypothetical protein [Photobacterium leiognathi]
MRLARTRNRRKQINNKRQQRHCRYRAQQFFHAIDTSHYSPYSPAHPAANASPFLVSPVLIYCNYPAFIPSFINSETSSTPMPCAMLLAA